MSDVRLARKYIGKADRAAKDGIGFELSFMSYRNLMKAKKCGYTGILLTEPRPGLPILATDRTIDRIDNTLGYVSGNVMTVCHAANQMKAVWENPNNPLTMELVSMMIKKLERR